MNRLYHNVFLILCLLLLSAQAQGQQATEGDVVVHKDPRIDILFRRNRPASPRPKVTGEIKNKADATNDEDDDEEEEDTPGTKEEVAAAVKPEVKAREVEWPVHHESRVVYSGKGFRVQIYNGSDRVAAIKTKSDFMLRFPSVRTYLIYTSPSFRVRVGDFRARGEAEDLLRKVRAKYHPSMIVPDNITISAY